MNTQDSPIARRLRHHGYKLTKPRLAVVQVLETGPPHLSPAEVYERARQIYPNLGLTTVYRTLDLLTELGALRAAYLGDTHQRYHPVTNGCHDHCVCATCGAILEVVDCFVAPMVAALEQKTGFQIEGHYLELYGRCPRCQTEES